MEENFRRLEEFKEGSKSTPIQKTAEQIVWWIPENLSRKRALKTLKCWRCGRLEEYINSKCYNGHESCDCQFTCSECM